MSFSLRQTFRYRQLRNPVCSVRARNVGSIRSTARLHNAPELPTPRPEVDGAKAEDPDHDTYEPFRTREKPALLRPLTFTLGIGICTFTGAAYLTRREFQELAQTSTMTGALVGDLRHERTMRELKQANAISEWLQDKGCPRFVLKSYAWLGDRWLNASDGERVALGLVAVNTVVFLAWQIPLSAVRFFMVKHFMHHPLSGRSYTLLTSAFSHMVSSSHGFPSLYKT